MALEKLVHTHNDGCDHREHSEDSYLPLNEKIPVHKSSIASKIAGMVGLRDRNRARNQPHFGENIGEHANGTATESKIPPTELSNLPPRIRTLQRYHGGANEERTHFMEENSALRYNGLAVAVEQVSIFLTANNTIVTFFEQSAEDVETPILNRLSTADTVLRTSTEASMLLQAVIDAIVDLAIPIASAYKDAIDELELNIITGKQRSRIRLLC